MSLISTTLFEKFKSNKLLCNLTAEQISEISSYIEIMYICKICFGKKGEYGKDGKWHTCSSCEGHGFIKPIGTTIVPEEDN